MITGFRQWILEVQEKSERTADKYEREVKHFTRNEGDPIDLTVDQIQAWRKRLQKKTRGSTINVKLAALKMYYDFLLEEGYVPHNPINDVKWAKSDAPLPNPLEWEGIVTVLNAMIDEANKTLYVKQDLAMFLVMYGSGLRREEAAELLLKAFEKRTRLIVTGKGGKTRITPVMDYELLGVLNWVLSFNWQDKEVQNITKRINKEAAFFDLVNRKPNMPLFYTPAGEAIIKYYKEPGHFIWRRMNYWSKKTGIKFRPHMLRHSFISELLNNNAQLQKVKEAAGHSDVRTTFNYFKILPQTAEELRANHRLNTYTSKSV